MSKNNITSLSVLTTAFLLASTTLFVGCGDSGSDGDGSGGSSMGGADGGTNGGTGGDAASGGSTSTIPSGTFLADDDGYVVFEIEDVAGENPPEPWVYGENEHCIGEGADETCSGPLDGGGYYKFGGASTCSQTSEEDVGLMTLNFQIAEAGMYRMAWRNMRDHTGDCANDLNNDSFVTFPSATQEAGHRTRFKVFGGGHDSYSWGGNQDAQNSPAGSFPDTNKKPVCVTFDAGIHEMSIAGRSNNHTIDRIALIPAESLEACQQNSLVKDMDERPLTSQQP